MGSGGLELSAEGETLHQTSKCRTLEGARMPPAEGEAAAPAVEARAEVPEVPVEGEGKASEAATTESAQAPAIEEDASTTEGEKSEKADEVESNVEAPKETEDQPVVEEGEVKAADSATPAENPDNAANPPENVDKLETN